jgi:YesN/AraC family two-component response regulator
MTIRILIVDDHEIVREGLISHLAKSRPDWDICGEATDGEQAIQLTRELKPDIVILDITMPRMSGRNLLRRTSETGTDTRRQSQLGNCVF